MPKRAKKKLKFEIRKSMGIYYEAGFTNIANKLYKSIAKAVDKVYSKA